MVLTCLTRDGVADHIIPFDPPLSQPSAVGEWFRRRVSADAITT